MATSRWSLWPHRRANQGRRRAGTTAFYSYHQTVLKALAGVETSLSNLTRDSQQRLALKDAALSAGKTLEMAQNRYENMASPTLRLCFRPSSNGIPRKAIWQPSNLHPDRALCAPAFATDARKGRSQSASCHVGRYRWVRAEIDSSNLPNSRRGHRPRHASSLSLGIPWLSAWGGFRASGFQVARHSAT